MKKLMFSMATPEIREIAAPFLRNHEDFARRNNFEYVAYSDRWFKDLHPSFSKTGYLQKALRDGWDFILHADLDVAFISQGVDLSNLLIGTDYWFAAYYQQNRWPTWKASEPYLNAGLFVVRQCPQAHEFVDEWVDRCVRGCPDWVPGQRTPIIDFPYENWHLHSCLKKFGYSGIRCCNAKEIGGFSEFWDDGVHWDESFPTVHFAGCKDGWEKRVEIFKSKYAKYVH